jgi:hypothetical protein
MGGCLLRESEAGSSLLGFGSGSVTGEDICERQTSESLLLDMEFGQGEPEGENSCEKSTLTRLYRDVLIGGLFDLGLGSIHESNAVVRWMHSDSFSICCQIAEWDDLWLIDLFRSTHHLSDCVKKPITRQCVEMLKAIARLETTAPRPVVVNDPFPTNTEHRSYSSDKIEGSEGNDSVISQAIPAASIAGQPQVP